MQYFLYTSHNAELGQCCTWCRAAAKGQLLPGRSSYVSQLASFTQSHTNADVHNVELKYQRAAFIY